MFSSVTVCFKSFAHIGERDSSVPKARRAQRPSLSWPLERSVLPKAGRYKLLIARLPLNTFMCPIIVLEPNNNNTIQERERMSTSSSITMGELLVDTIRIVNFGVVSGKPACLASNATVYA